MGNVIAEYEKTGTGDATWQRDYVYGATNEAVYMKFPQSTTTNDEFDNFVAFAEAWLCEPNCTTADLLWDIDDSNNVDLVDFALSVLNLDDAFTINGRYLLTDFRNSVIGFVGLDNSVIEITYNAWGSPSYSGDLEGLSILWNGYYYDTETDNYYLRNRYYSSLERKFVTEDPHGTNPDGTWNNSFGIRDQHGDGYGLSVYVNGDPVNGFDPWGLFSKTTKKKFIKWYYDNKDISWTNSLPDCPCKIVICRGKPMKPKEKWGNPSDKLHGYHVGAKWCMRSNPVDGHANQCCYSKKGKLITSGSGIGSADYAPGTWKTFFAHKKHDMDPADWANKLDGGKWGKYSEMYIGRRPQKGTDKCPSNPT